MIRRGDQVVFVTGSGLSAPSGIPTFRGEGGVWARFVLEWGTRQAFLSDPRAWYNKFWIPAHVVAEPGSTTERRYEPSGGHLAVTKLALGAKNVRGLPARARHWHGTSTARARHEHGMGTARALPAHCIVPLPAHCMCPPLQVRVITQNIDGLHERAGLPAECSVEVHGRADLFKCVAPG